jgi:hypothetical protein
MPKSHEEVLQFIVNSSPAPSIWDLEDIKRTPNERVSKGVLRGMFLDLEIEVREATREITPRVSLHVNLAHKDLPLTSAREFAQELLLAIEQGEVLAQEARDFWGT